MTNALELAAGAVPAGTLFIAASILLFPHVPTFCFGWAAFHSRQREQTKTWLVYRGFGRFVLAATVAGWWVIWDVLLRKSLGTFDTSTAETLLFWVPPIVSLGIFLISCCIVDRKLLRQR